jgi:hypothetical protein
MPAAGDRPVGTGNTNETSAPKPLYTVKPSDDAKVAASAIGLRREWEER